MHFATLADWLKDAKLSNVCSAHALDAIDPINRSSEQQTLLNAIPDPLFCQSMCPPLTLARGSSDVQYLASPVSGSGVNRFEQLFLLAQRQGHKTRSDWARITWQVRQSQGQRQLKDGRPMESAEDNLAELTREAETFAEKRLAILQALGMV